jgi:hypothetical protein
VKALGASLLLAVAARAGAAQETAPQPPPPMRVPRITPSVTIDGALTDPAWKDAAVLDEFWETSPGDNVPPPVKTVAYLGYDDKFFYIGVRCLDPQPNRVRAPYVERDQVLGTDDNVAIFLDTRNDRRSAMEFRVNPRGIQGDAMWNDANQTEDFSPDFFYDTAAQVGPEGWTAELRIPFSTLRYPRKDPQEWGILIWRNYPRAYRYAIHSSPIPRGSNCLICHMRALTDLQGLPSGAHYVVAPYVTAKEDGVSRDPSNPDSSFFNMPVEPDGGGDIKWIPNPDTALDATINPDFSQVEADTAQLVVNERFALFFPEKRPFFLEGVDLFQTPINAVYTRTITSPLWGLRGTGQVASSTYTVLATQDRGGGLVILPGPEGSRFAPQDYESYVVIGRLRRDVGASYGGLLFTDRDIIGGGHNIVGGPDFQLAIGTDDRITGQYLYSETREPDRPDLTPEWDGQRQAGHGLDLAWRHTTRAFFTNLIYRDFSNGFRADDGFVPQVGYREGNLEGGLSFYPAGLFNFLQPYGGVAYQEDREGKLLFRRFFPGINFQGRLNLTGFLGANLDTVRVGGRYLDADYAAFQVQVDPSRRITRIGVSGNYGQQIDFDNAREGTGGEISVQLTARPTDHLELLMLGVRGWLDVPVNGADKARLFTATIARLKANYVFNARVFIRAIGQWVETERDPTLYTFPVPAREGFFDGSVLLAYQLNWQTVAYLGYGDSRELVSADAPLRVPAGTYSLSATRRQFFLKLSYAFQR